MSFGYIGTEYVAISDIKRGIITFGENVAKSERTPGISNLRTSISSFFGTFTPLHRLFDGITTETYAQLLTWDTAGSPDINSYNTNTNVGVCFNSQKYVTTIRILRGAGPAGDKEVTNDVIMKLEYSDDNITYNKIGNSFVIPAGFGDTWFEYNFPLLSTPHLYWRIYYDSGVTGGSIWIRELEFWGD